MPYFDEGIANACFRFGAQFGNKCAINQVVPKIQS